LGSGVEGVCVDRKRDNETDREADRQTEKEKDSQRARWRHRKIDRRMDGWKNEGESINRSQIDIKRKTSDIRNWKKTFISRYIVH
jgi:hypothetical protein